MQKKGKRVPLGYHAARGGHPEQGPRRTLHHGKRGAPRGAKRLVFCFFCFFVFFLLGWVSLFLFFGWVGLSW